MSEGDITARMKGQDIGRSKNLVILQENYRGDGVPIASGTLAELRDMWIQQGIDAGIQKAAAICKTWEKFYRKSGEADLAAGCGFCASSILSTAPANPLTSTDPVSNADEK